ncbi:hypothetical protein N8152_01550 [bacterium]|nr:hypothetical protein [bacterium]MDC1215492.1 hypothetical protein [bacterium]
MAESYTTAYKFIHPSMKRSMKLSKKLRISVRRAFSASVTFSFLYLFTYGQQHDKRTYEECISQLEQSTDNEGDYFPEFSSVDDGRGRLFVEVSHGLGNRLRALLSAISIAHRANRHLTVIWPKDLHMNASLDHLLHLDGIDVYQQSFMPCALATRDFVVIDYVGHPVDFEHRAPIDFQVPSHIYVRTAYSVRSVKGDKYEENLLQKEIQSIRPNPAVRTLMSEIKLQLWEQHHISIRDVTAVHVRMEGDLAKDVPGIVDLPKNDHRRATSRMRVTAKKREKCHYQNFIDHVRLRRKLGKSDSLFFVCSDTTGVPEALEAVLGPAIFSPRLPLHDICQGVLARSKECIQLALAELLLLSKAHSFISSTWSSFSEVVDIFGSFEGGSTTGCAP